MAETSKTTAAPHSQHGHDGSTGLWRHRGFLLLWGGQTISQFGSQITQWALPLTSVLLLKATLGQVGILAAAGFLPILLSLFAGVWVDRVRRRPLLIIADSGRALLLGTIPLAYWFGWLSLTQLYLVALLHWHVTGMACVICVTTDGSIAFPMITEHDQPSVVLRSLQDLSKAILALYAPLYVSRTANRIASGLVMLDCLST